MSAAFDLGSEASAAQAAGEEDDGRHPDECPCQFCDEDRRDAAAQDDEDDSDPWGTPPEELDDDTDNAIPDTERGSEDEADYAPASPAFIAGPTHDPQWSGW